MVHAEFGDHSRGRLVPHVERLKQPSRQARLVSRLLHPLGAERGLVRVLQHHRVAGHKRGTTAFTAVRSG